MSKYPRYLNLLETGELKSRAEKLKDIYRNCVLCPWDCRIDRTAGKLGVCKGSDTAKISSATPHFGEEPMISGKKGSGTIFFSHCNMHCRYCQNYQISREGLGNEISDGQLADLMLMLKSKGCHNINLVSPTHYLPNIMSALVAAAEKGLDIPLVYNTNGYEKTETMEMLDGIVDIYLPDIKYSVNHTAVKFSNAPKYFDYNRAALKEMQRQVGDMKLDKDGIALKGLLVRHLVLPNDLADSQKAFRFLANEISTDVYVAVMAQYKPCYDAVNDPNLGRPLMPDEYRKAVRWAKEAGLYNILTQELGSSEVFIPDFKRADPFK